MSHLQSLREQEEKIAEDGAVDDIPFTYDRPDLSNKVTLRRSSTGLWKVCSSGHNHNSDCDAKRYNSKESPFNIIADDEGREEHFGKSENVAANTLVNSKIGGSGVSVQCCRHSNSEPKVEHNSLKKYDTTISKPSRRGIRSRTFVGDSVKETQNSRIMTDSATESHINHKYPTRQKGPSSR